VALKISGKFHFGKFIYKQFNGCSFLYDADAMTACCNLTTFGGRHHANCSSIAYASLAAPYSMREDFIHDLGLVDQP